MIRNKKQTTIPIASQRLRNVHKKKIQKVVEIYYHHRESDMKKNANRSILDIGNNSGF